jgi:hypothetical protein
MQKFKNQFGFLLAIFVCVAVIFACSKLKEESSDDDTKKEDTKETTTSEDTKKESSDERRSSGNSYDGSKLYFCETYSDASGEIGVSDVFTIPRSGGYLTVMIDLRPADATIGTGKVDLRITRYEGDKEKIVETLPFDVQPDWDYIHFDKVTFYKSGDYKVTLLKNDGTPVASGEVAINYR